VRPEAVAWERAAEVREAAGGWLRAGAIDRPTHEAISQAYPDPCVTPSAVWRILTAAMVTAVLLCALSAVWIAAQPGAAGLSLLLFVFAGACLVATERVDASPRLARRGAAGATSFWGSVLCLAGLALFLHESLRVGSDHAEVLFLTSAIVWGAGCWRWGSPLFVGLSAVSVLLFLARLPLGRLLWVLAGAALVGLAARRIDEASWAPSHRRAAMVLVLTGVAAVYVAVNVYSLDVRFLEDLRRPFAPRSPAPPLGLFVVAAVATAILPLGVLAWGWRTRRTLLLDAGIVLVGLSLATLRHYVHVAPLWVALVVAGAVLVAVALAVERALRRSPGGERAGFTADALFSDERRQQLLQTVPVVGAFTPTAPPAAADEPGFAGRGGTFGGGGASERF
jgi:hypothetical protein